MSTENFDAKARPQQGSTVEIRSRRSLPLAVRPTQLPYGALAFSGRQASGSNAASEGCHSTGQLVMSDKQTVTTMSNDTPEKIACLRNSRMLHVRALA